MGKFSPTTQTSTNTFQPPEQLWQLLNPAIQAGLNFMQNPPTLRPGSSVAGFTPQQIAAQRALLGSIGGQNALLRSATGAQTHLLSKDILDPRSNPALQATIDASVRPIYQNLAEQVLPTIRGSAITNNAYGGSRQGIAEGLASRGASQAAGDTAAKVATQGYGQGLNAMLQSLQLTPQTLQAMLSPGLTRGAVGQQQQAQNQAVLNDQIYRHMYAQLAPWLAAQNVAQLGLAIPGGTSTSTTPGPQQNPWSTALGIGSGLLGLFSGNPFMALGGFGSALTPAAANAGYGGRVGLF